LTIFRRSPDTSAAATSREGNDTWSRLTPTFLIGPPETIAQGYGVMRWLAVVYAIGNITELVAMSRSPPIAVRAKSGAVAASALDRAGPQRGRD